MSKRVGSLPANPAGEQSSVECLPKAVGLCADTFGGRVHVEWDSSAAATPLGQLPFFIEFLKLGGLFDPWVADCPLTLTSPNAPAKRDILGTLLLAVLAGHQRYAHITALRGDGVNAALLGMRRVMSEDSVRRALAKIERQPGWSGCSAISTIPSGRCWASRGSSTWIPRSSRCTVGRRARWSATIRASRVGRRTPTTAMRSPSCG